MTITIHVGSTHNFTEKQVLKVTRISDLAIGNNVALNGITLSNVGQTVEQAIQSTGALAPYYFLGVTKQSNGRK